MSTNPIFRTPTDGCYRLVTTAFGSYLSRARDPLAEGEIPDEALKTFELHEDPPRIPAELWSAWIKLCFHFVQNGNGVEVGCRILRHAEDHSQWRILIPKQVVCGASVQVETCDNAVDLITGEVVPSYPPEGWQPMGTSHSHNTMSAFFSSTDDSTELGDPGMHVVVGDVNIDKMTYSLKASITAHLKRYAIDYEKVIDTTPQTTDFHPGALAVVGMVPLHNSWSLGGLAFLSSGWLPGRRSTRRWSEADQTWKDRLLDSKDAKDFRWLNDQEGAPEPGEPSEEMEAAHEQINELYTRIMRIQDYQCKNTQDLSELYYELEQVIQRMEEVLEPKAVKAK